MCVRSRAHFSTVPIPAGKIKFSCVCGLMFFVVVLVRNFPFLPAQLNVSWQTRGFGLHFTPPKSNENGKRSTYDSDTSARAIKTVSANSFVADICYMKRKYIKYRRIKNTGSYIWHASVRSGENERSQCQLSYDKRAFM